MNRPFLLISIPFALGILTTYYFDLSLNGTLFLFGVLFFIYIISLMKKKSNNLLFILLFFVLGGVLTSYYQSSSLLSTFLGKNIEIEGTIHEIMWEDEEASKYVVKVKNIWDGKSIKKVREKTVLKITGESHLDLGDNIVFRANLREPLSNTNPKLYNYKLNLLSNKIYTSANIRDYSIINIDREKTSFNYRLRIGFRDKVENLFDKYLDQSPSSLIKGIVMGENSYLEEDDILKYRKMGLAHVLAVSGLHIGIISGFLIFLFSRLRIKKKTNVIMVLSIVWFYGFLIGFPPSVLRASIMFSFLFYGETKAELYDPINTLFLSFLILLIGSPILLFNLGFQLSYVATFSILFFSPYISKSFYPYNNKFTYTLGALFSVYIGILPLQLYYFNSFSFIGIFSNLIIAPILSLSLILGGIMLILSYIGPFLNIFIGGILNFILLIQEYLVDIIYTKEIGTIRFYSPGIYEFILYYISVCIFLKILDLRNLKFHVKKSILTYTIFFIVYSFIFNFFNNSMEIDFLDVGQGDCILLKNNTDSYLIDTGGNVFSDFDIGKNIVLPYLQKQGITNLKAMFITHFHLDHCKSLPILMENLNIKNIFISYENHDSEIYKYMEEENIPFKILVEGDKIYLNKDLNIEVLSPGIDYEKKGFSENNMSLVFNLSYFNKDILFTGDMEKEAENILSKKLNKEIYLLKVPHHGSQTSSTEELLNILRPKVGVISVGRNNFYNHPDPPIIERYKEMGTEIYRTDTMGMIRVNLNKEDSKITPFLNKKSFLEVLDKYFFDLIFIMLYYLISYVIIKIYFFREEELGKYELQ